MNRPMILLAAVFLLLPARSQAELPVPIKTLKHDDPVDLVAFSPDGKLLAVGNRNTISLWKLGTTQEPRRLTVRVGRFVNLSFSPDSLFLASSGTDGHLRLWAVATGEEVRDFDKTSQVIHYGSFAPDGKTIAAGTQSGMVRRWDPLTGRELPAFQVTAVGCSLTFSPNGKAMALGASFSRTSGDGIVVRGLPLLDAATGIPLRSFQGYAATAVFAPDGRTILGWPDNDMIRLWETCTGKVRGRIPGKFGSVSISPDGTFLAAADRAENIIRIWDLAILKEIQRLDGHDSDISSLAFSPDGKMLASGGGDFAVLLWDMREVRKKLATEPLTLSEIDLLNRWTYLGADDAERAYQAIVSLSGSPKESIPFLETQ
jgi:WD40 repeat protein